MASWSDVSAVAHKFGAQRLGDSAWLFEIQGTDESRQQKVFVNYELMPPDFEFLKISSVLTHVKGVDTREILEKAGQFQVGSLNYTPDFDEDGRITDGFITLGTTIPLALIDISDPTWFLLYLHILAHTADAQEQQFSALSKLDPRLDTF